MSVLVQIMASEIFQRRIETALKHPFKMFNKATILAWARELVLAAMQLAPLTEMSDRQACRLTLISLYSGS